MQNLSWKAIFVVSSSN